MKRLISTLTVLLLVGLILAGCASSPSPTTTAPPPVTAPTTTSVAPSTTAPPATTSKPPTTTPPSTTTTTPPPTTPAAPQVLKIGGLFGLTGFFSDFDQVQAQEAQLTVDMINAAGGVMVQGQQYNIQLITYDFKSTVDGVTAGANQLIFQDKVKFIIAPSAFFSGASTDICESNKVIRGETFVSGTVQELGPNMPYTFLCHNSAFEHALTVIKYLKQTYPDVKTVAYVTPGDAQPDTIAKVTAMLNQANLTVVGQPILFANETIDFSPIASKLVASKADAIFMMNGVGFHAGNLLKSVRQLGSNMLYAAAIDNAPIDILTIAQPSNSNRFFAPGIYKGAPSTPPLMQTYIDQIYAKYGERSIHLQSVNVLYMFKQAIEKANSLDTTVVRDTWEKMDTMQTPYGTAKLGGLQTYGIKHAYSHPDQVWTLDNGQPKFGAWIDVSPMP